MFCCITINIPNRNGRSNNKRSINRNFFLFRWFRWYCSTPYGACYINLRYARDCSRNFFFSIFYERKCIRSIFKLHNSFSLCSRIFVVDSTSYNLSGYVTVNECTALDIVDLIIFLNCAIFKNTSWNSSESQSATTSFIRIIIRTVGNNRTIRKSSSADHIIIIDLSRVIFRVFGIKANFGISCNRAIILYLP